MYSSSNISSFLKPLNPPPFIPFHSPFLSKFPTPLSKSPPNYLSITKTTLKILSLSQKPPNRSSVTTFAGRSKGKPGNTSGGRIEGNSDVRREAKKNARRKSKKYAESLFYRLKNPHKNYPDNFSEQELQMIGLGYDRMVRFMEKDDPNLKHPYDWYKYGEFGPYSWKGVVLGDPVRGRFSDERVTMIGEVRDQEEWEEIEKHDMAIDFQTRLDGMEKRENLKYFWVFVRHPKWNVADVPWEQWTLVCEVAVEVKVKDERLDKWTLMGRLGNHTRSLITQCAAWMRPDIVYVKRPVYQCRFEAQDEFFAALAPMLDPETERDYPCELEGEDGRVELCSYFGGLCKIVRVNPKSFVDDVVKGYEKLSDEKKSKCLEFVFKNHPVMLLHPYTKEWKAKLEEMELGCDAPDEYESGGMNEEIEVLDWVEYEGNEDGCGTDEGNEDSNDDDIIIDAEEGEDEELGILEEDEDKSPEENIEYWDKEFQKAITSNEDMEKLVKRSIETADKYYENQMKPMGGWQKKERGEMSIGDGDEREMRGKRAKVSPKEWKLLGYGPYRKRVDKGKIPPGLFLRAAVRPFTYKNLIKEIVLTRHAIVEGEIGRKP